MGEWPLGVIMYEMLIGVATGGHHVHGGVVRSMGQV